MKLRFNFKSVFIEAVSLLFVLLFVYAAIAKFLDFENFQIQLGQSPLLSVFASWIAWLVPIIELLIAILLVIPKFRNIGLWASFSLMIMFTVYIFIVLHYSSFVPCSCGGILEKMSWNVHLIFNIIFVILAVAAILFNMKIKQTNTARAKYLKTFKGLAGITAFSTLAVVILFLSSENIMHNENPFIRRFPPHPAEFSNAIDLKFNSFYFAGFSNKRLYLGNFTTPSKIISLNENLGDWQVKNIQFDPKDIPFKIVTTAVRDSFFYLVDGSVPKIFRGSLTDWRINKELKGTPYFNRAVPIDSNNIVFRSNNGRKLTSVLGVYTAAETPAIHYNKKLLQQQIDGIFDTDGTLLYSEKMHKIIYVYYYRNEFVVADKSGFLSFRGNTIDTTKYAKIKVATLKNGTQYAMSSPSYAINAHAAVWQNLLYVHSTAKGRFESKSVREKSFVIDVYDLNKNNYLFSFPIYHTSSDKLVSLLVTDAHLYAIIGNELVVYELRDALRKEIKSI
ncbi:MULTISPECIES: MauE/DoxX family redox-associated membrane protein [Flavobacterium]|uniref:Putative membrane protein YphA (DoxX/SURF4 family) n=1 Tax=Flavobacterium cutihirudinis TaxID=1265740 RepID=A0A3D9G1D4_9FLAO|nr:MULTISPECIES: MauE/DoxX family redox-associated membrane protein [Flavobacterium]MBZ4040935.1 hypothetical protein [Flavobacterium hibisci]RED26999.1 putative membrane protein YphA (DoxX/SURF4 family) [Flavobacterium cutihirudinis]